MTEPDVNAEAGRLRFERTFAADRDTVWRYLVEEDLRSRWLCRGAVDAVVGGVMEFHFDPDDYWQSPPEGFPVETLKAKFDGEITAIEPPALLAFTWPGEQDAEFTLVTIALSETEEGTRMELVHERLTKPAHLVGALAGWHAHLEQLACSIAQRPAPNFWVHHSELEESYQSQFGA